MAGALVSFLALNVLLHLLPVSHSTSTVVLDGLAAGRKTHTLHVGDSLVFKNKNLQNLYLFHTRRAFDNCIFSQATILYRAEANPSPTHFMWHPSTPGYYYFSTRDKSTRGACERGEKVPVRVIAPLPPLTLSFPPLTSPPPTSGGDFFPSPSNGGWASSSPSNMPAAGAPSPALQLEISSPSPSPSASGDPDLVGGIPFISSNPAVPLPTGETDSATIRPLPTPGDGTQGVGLGTKLRDELTFLVFVMISSMLYFWHPM